MADEAWIVTDPAHGGKVDCHKCGKWIYENEEHFEFRPSNPGVWFHLSCFNKYEHYYGLDRPID